MADADSTFTPEQIAELTGIPNNGKRSKDEIDEIIHRLTEALRLSRRLQRGEPSAPDSAIRGELQDIHKTGSGWTG